jgi:enamine deaminase RidA (YjgF/YER057c/UK114 family)
MAHDYIQPAGLFDSRSFGFSQVVKATAGQTIFLAGQGAFDAKFKLIGDGDVGAQAACALNNIKIALEAAAATTADLTSLRIYVVNYKPEDATAIGAALAAFFGDSPCPAQTLIGVQALGMPGMLIEIEATAVVG